MDTTEHFVVGVNGGPESMKFVKRLIPEQAQIVLHGLECRNENRTILAMEQWLPCHEDWNVLYFHARGATHPPKDSITDAWRNCMMRHTVSNWRRCVEDLDDGYDAVGAHWMEPPATPKGQYIFAGTFWWAKASYLLTLPSILDRDRIRESGIDALESRYEAEVWIGNGPVKPKVKDYHGPNWNPSKWQTCLK